MYCDRCNVEFGEGLRYCKWCGQPLSAASRATGELLRCPGCGDAVRTTWVFCKTCGGRLDFAAEKSESGQVGKHCESCGEHVEPDWPYCKACGHRLLQEFPEAGGARATTTIADFDEITGARLAQEDNSQAGALPFQIGSGQANSKETAESDTQAINSGIDPGVRRGVETTILPSPAQGDEHTSTSVFRKSRTTSIIDSESLFLEDEAPAAKRPAGEPSGSPESAVPPVADRLRDHSEGILSPPDHTPPSSAAHPELNEEAGPPSATEGLEAGEFVVLEPADALPAWNAFPSMEEPEHKAGSPEEQATFAFAEHADLKAQQPDVGEQQPAFLVTEGLESELASQSVNASNDQPRVPGSPTSGRESAPAGFEEKPVAPAAKDSGPSELEKWDSRVRSLGGSAAPPATPPVKPTQEFGRGVERDFRAPVRPPAAPARRSAMIILIAAGIVIAGIIALVVVWRVALSGLRNRNQQPQTSTTPVPATSPQVSATPVTAAPEGMVLVEAGTYDIGRDDGDEYAKPRHSVTLAAFYIDRTEVTNAAYKKFIDATGRSGPEGWTDGSYPSGAENLPVINVSWKDAADYAQWAGKRLPTETEWEAAARGKEGRVYPWGNRFRPGLANIESEGVIEVGKFAEGAAASGALDMIGNVWEWTSDEFHFYPGNEGSRPENLRRDITYRVVRGGAYDGNEIHDATYRGFLDGSKGYSRTGFRTVKNAD